MRLHHALFIICAIWASSTSAEELQVISVGTVGPAMKEIIPAFERTTGNTVRVAFGNPGATVRNLKEHPTADVGLVPLSVWPDAVATGTFDPSNRVLIAKTRIGVAIKEGAKPFDITKTDSVRQAMTDATSICLGDPQGGSPATAALFLALEKVQMADDVRRKAKTFPTGEAIGHAVAKGECEMGISTFSELKSVPGINVIGALSADFIDFAPVTFAVALNESKRPKLAQEFIGFLSSDAARTAFQKAGLDPNQ
jgi:molybdate transport system substrate-binding protein